MSHNRSRNIAILVILGQQGRLTSVAYEQQNRNSKQKRTTSACGDGGDFDDVRGFPYFRRSSERARGPCGLNGHGYVGYVDVQQNFHKQHQTGGE